MKLHCLTPVLAFILILFGIVNTASSQMTEYLFGSTRGMPTRLFGSTKELGCEPACAQEPSCAQKPSCARKGSCGSSCGCQQKSWGQSYGEETIVSGCGPVGGCKTSCDRLPRKGCSIGGGCSSERSCGIAGALGKLDAAVKGLFRCNRSNCFDACCCQTPCCTVEPSCGYEAGCGCEPGEYFMPVPVEELEGSSADGNPFEDDRIQPLTPPVPSAARRGPVSRSPIGTVTYTRPATAAGTTSPARFRPDNATPIKRQTRLTRSILDRVD